MPDTSAPGESIMEPSTSHCTYNVGDFVDIRGYGRCTVACTSSQNPKFMGRIQVQYPDGKTYWARPEVLRKVHPTKKRLVVCRTTTEYRTAAIMNTFPNDVCLEVGCHEGVTTHIINSRCSFVIGVDSSDITVQAAKAKYPGVRFETVDGFDLERLRALSPTGTFNRIFVDVGGIAPLQLVLSLVGLYFREFKRATIIVKSVHMHAFLGNAEIFGFDKHRTWGLAPAAAAAAAGAEGAEGDGNESEDDGEEEQGDQAEGPSPASRASQGSQAKHCCNAGRAGQAAAPPALEAVPALAASPAAAAAAAAAPSFAPASSC